MKPNMRNYIFSIGLCFITTCSLTDAATVAYPIVDTGQNQCFDNYREISDPLPGQAFSGQDAQYRGNAPVYRDNRDGTVTDLVTGLMWQKGMGDKKVTLEEARKIAREMKLGGYTDWRVPTIKELFSLIDFRGNTGFSKRMDFHKVPSNAVPYINTDYFDFTFGNVREGERYIDAQWLSSTEYVSTTMDGMDTLFGVNFSDGRIKGYGYRKRGTKRHVKTFFVRFVRGKVYGANRFIDNGDGTITDHSTGLTWMKKDSGRAMSWRDALSYAEKLDFAGYRDWRLPNAKELQSIVDYSRSPDTTGSPAIDPVFKCTSITNEAGRKDYPFYWTSTTHLDGPRPGDRAVYIAFGRAMGSMHGMAMDVHGAGAQRSDPKVGVPGLGRGPQGDAQRIVNFIRCVRGGIAVRTKSEAPSDHNHYPYKVKLAANLPAGISGPLSERKHDSIDSDCRRKDGCHDTEVPEDMRKNFVRRLDRDGDGRVSRSEFDGPPDRFDFHDRNNDGYLTEEEAPRVPPRGQKPLH